MVCKDLKKTHLNNLKDKDILQEEDHQEEDHQEDEAEEEDIEKID